MNGNKKKHTFLKWCAVLLVIALLLAAIVGLQHLTATPADVSGSTVQEQVIMGTVYSGSLATGIPAYGSLSYPDTETLSIPGSIRLTAFHVSEGDIVHAGDIIATADQTSVLAAIADLDELIVDLDKAITKAKDASISKAINATAKGTVVRILAGKGDSVADVMYQNGSLLVLSLDGLLCLDIPNDGTLSIGTPVLVNGPAGSFPGTVAEIGRDTVTITVSLDDLAYEDAVSVIAMDGTPLGEGSLEVYHRMDITGFSGTVSSVAVKEGSSVKNGTRLFQLTDTAYPAEYEVLLSRRDTLAEQYNQLVAISRDGYLHADADCIITGLNTDLLQDAFDDSDASADRATGSLRETVLRALSHLFVRPAPLHDQEDTAPEEETVTKTVQLIWFAANGSMLTEGLPPEVEILLLKDGTPYTCGTVSSETEWVLEFPGLPRNQDGKRIRYEVSEDTLPEGFEPTIQSSGNVITVMLKQVLTSPFPGGWGGGSHGFGGTSSGSTAATQEKTYRFAETAICNYVTSESVLIQTTVDELEIASIRNDAPVQITLDSFPNEAFTGTVTAIDPFGTNSGGNTKYTVTITLPRQDGMLTGMNAGLLFPAEEEDNGLLVSLDALEEQAGHTYLYTAYDGEKDALSGRMEVVVGKGDGKNALLLSGLAEGSTYYYRYADTIISSFREEISH